MFTEEERVLLDLVMSVYTGHNHNHIMVPLNVACMHANIIFNFFAVG